LAVVVMSNLKRLVESRTMEGEYEERLKPEAEPA
jgi:hypothetical protein